MKNYIELTLLPNIEEDIPIHFLWEKVYQQLHLALVEVKNASNEISIGVSFPNYDAQQHQLGCKLRLFASSEPELNDLDVGKWLNRLSDYVHWTSPRPIPDNVTQYAYFKRLQPKSNLERIARRKAKYEGIPFDDALKSMDNKKEVYSQAPFIRINSLSSNNPFRLLIEKTETDQLIYNKGFSTCGLSAHSSVPLF